MRVRAAAMVHTLVLLLALHAAAQKKKPHVLFIVADDYGWNDVGYHY